MYEKYDESCLEALFLHPKTTYNIEKQTLNPLF